MARGGGGWPAGARGGAGGHGAGRAADRRVELPLARRLRRRLRRRGVRTRERPSSAELGRIVSYQLGSASNLIAEQEQISDSF